MEKLDEDLRGLIELLQDEACLKALLSAEPEASAASSTNSAKSGDNMSFQKVQCLKTKMCKFHAEGRCAKGAKCSFAHSAAELRLRPDLSRTKICQRWLQGACQDATSCMAEYWKSTPKHHCPICNVSLPAHPRSIAAHEASDMHAARKASALTRLERAAADKAAADLTLRNTLYAIDAAAAASMRRHIDQEALGGPLTQPAIRPAPQVLSYQEALSRVKPPPLDPQRKQQEMQRLEAFIGEKVSQRPSIIPTAEFIAAPLDPTYYAGWADLPELVKQDPRCQGSRSWIQQAHESTGLPIWHNPARNIYLWAAPPASAEPSVKAKVSEQLTAEQTKAELAADTEFKIELAADAQPKIEAKAEPAVDEATDPPALSLEAVVQRALMLSRQGAVLSEGRPGAWTEVAAEASPGPETVKEPRARALEELLAEKSERSELRAEATEALEAEDQERRSRMPVKELPRATGGFKKRKLVPGGGADFQGFVFTRPKVYTGFVAQALNSCAKGFLRSGLLLQTLALFGMISFHYAYGGLSYFTWDLRHTNEEMRASSGYRDSLLTFNIMYFIGSISVSAFQASLADDATWSRGYRAGSKLLAYAAFFDVIAATMSLAWSLNFASYYTEAMWTHFKDGNLDWLFCNGARVIRAVAYMGYGLAFFLLEVYHDEGTNEWHGGANMLLYMLAGMSELSVLLFADSAFSGALTLVALISALLWAVAFEEELNATSPALTESELCNELEKQMDQYARVNPLAV